MVIEVVFHPRWWHLHAGVSFGKDFFCDAGYRIEADMRMRRCLFEHFGRYGLGDEHPDPRPVIGSDLLASGYLASWMLGCEVKFAPNDPPQVLCANLCDEDVLGLSVPSFETNPVWQNVVRQLDALEDRFGYVQTHINLMGVFNVALDLRGQQLFVDFYDNPELAEHLLSVCTKTISQIGHRLRKYSDELSSGVTSVMAKVAPKVYLTSNCTVDMVSLDFYEHFLLKYDIALAQAFSPFGVHHCGKSMERLIGGYVKIPNLKFVEVGAGSDIDQVMAALPSDVRVNLRLSPVSLQTDSHEQVVRQIRHMREIVPESRLSISCVGLDDKISDERIEWLLEHAKGGCAK